MLRQLLTLLAVFSGFTLAAEPVRAAEAGIVSVQAMVDADDCKIIAIAPLQQMDSRVASDADEGPCRRPVIQVQAPTVMLQVDRARE